MEAVYVVCFVGLVVSLFLLGQHIKTQRKLGEKRDFRFATGQELFPQDRQWNAEAVAQAATAIPAAKEKHLAELAADVAKRIEVANILAALDKRISGHQAEIFTLDQRAALLPGLQEKWAAETPVREETAHA